MFRTVQTSLWVAVVGLSVMGCGGGLGTDKEPTLQQTQQLEQENKAITEALPADLSTAPKAK